MIDQKKVVTFAAQDIRGSYLRDCVKRSKSYLHVVDFLRSHVKKLISPWKVNYLKLRGDENTHWQKISVHFTYYLVNDFVANVTLKIWKIMDITENTVVLLSSRCCSKNLSEYIAHSRSHLIIKKISSITFWITKFLIPVWLLRILPSWNC